MIDLYKLYSRVREYWSPRMEEFISATYKAIEGNSNKFVSDEPAWILGVEYDASTEKGMEAVREDIRSRQWHTYRYGFAPLGNGDTSDKGWGCMLRCAQMLLAEAAQRVRLGRQWRWSPGCSNPDYCQTLRLFQDLEDSTAPFSLHNMTFYGADLGKPAGTWLGPCTVTHVIKEVVALATSIDFAVHNVADRLFIVDEIRQTPKTQRHAYHTWDPLIVMCPTSFGAGGRFDKERHLPVLQKFFKSPHCLGILGGTPGHALYLLGLCGEEVIVLDPHTNQPAEPIGDLQSLEHWQHDHTYHCADLVKNDAQHLDTSCALAFLCRTEAEFDELVTYVRTHLADFLDIHATRPAALRALEEDARAGRTVCLDTDESGGEEDGFVLYD